MSPLKIADIDFTQLLSNSYFSRDFSSNKYPTYYTVLSYFAELFAVTPEIGQHIIPVFIELNYRPTSNRSGNDIPNVRRTATPSSPSQHYLPLPGQQFTQMDYPSPNISTRMFGDGEDSEDLSHLHLIGRVCLDQSASELMTKVKNLFQVSVQTLSLLISF